MQDVSKEPITFTELLAEPGVTERLDLRSRFGFCAYHGGNLERVTDVIATEAAERAGASLYTVTQPLDMRRHIPSTLVGVEQSPGLKAFLDHCEVVVSLHGYGRRNLFTALLCGGRNRELAAHVAHHIRLTLPAYRTIDDVDEIPEGLRGLHPDNPCNLARGGGMQIELPPRVRGLSPLAKWWPSRQRTDRQRFPHVNYLVDGLVAAAEAWPLEDPAASR